MSENQDPKGAAAGDAGGKIEIDPEKARLSNSRSRPDKAFRWASLADW